MRSRGIRLRAITNESKSAPRPAREPSRSTREIPRPTKIPPRAGQGIPKRILRLTQTTQNAPAPPPMKPPGLPQDGSKTTQSFPRSRRDSHKAAKTALRHPQDCPKMPESVLFCRRRRPTCSTKPNAKQLHFLSRPPRVRNFLLPLKLDQLTGLKPHSHTFRVDDVESVISCCL